MCALEIMSLLHTVVFAFCLYFCFAQLTIKKNPLLSRQRRYLLFPEGSNFVMTMSLVKSVMIKVPRLINVLAECDVPFRLPSDPRMIRQHKFHRQKREIYSQLEDAFTQYGVNGKACLKRMICDANMYLPHKGQSLVGDLLATVFMCLGYGLNCYICAGSPAGDCASFKQNSYCVQDCSSKVPDSDEFEQYCIRFYELDKVKPKLFVRGCAAIPKNEINACAFYARYMNITNCMSCTTSLCNGGPI